MRHVVAEELKNDMINYRMFTGCILIIVVALLSRIDMFQKLIEFGNSPEGPGWYSAYRYCVYAYNTLLVIPIAVTFAAGESAEMELRSRFCLFSYIRSGKRKYLIAKAMGLIVSGGMMVVFSMFVLLVFSIIGFAKIPALDPENINLAEITPMGGVYFPGRIFERCILVCDRGNGSCFHQKQVYGLYSTFYSVLCSDSLSGTLF